MRPILYRGWPVVLAGPGEVHFHPALIELAELDECHPLVRFSCALALHAFEVDSGLEPGPFDQGRAERFARQLLMPAEEFTRSPTSRMPSWPTASACPSNTFLLGGSSSVRRR